MKRIVQGGQLHLLRASVHSRPNINRFFSATHLDTTLIFVSLAGLLSAYVFLATMS